MKKAISIIGGAAAVLALAVPAFAQFYLPDVNANVVAVYSNTTANANSGRNRARSFVGATGITSGAAYADALTNVQVTRQENGDERPAYNPCQPWWMSCNQGEEEAVDLNVAAVYSDTTANANTGHNRARSFAGSTGITSGRADSVATTQVLVGVQVNGLR